MKDIITRFQQTAFLNKKSTWGVVILIGLILKVGFFRVESADFNCFLNPWMNFIKTHGYGLSLRYNFYNYTPPYIYILIGIAKLGFNPLYSIKVVSILFEFMGAFFIGKIVGLTYKSKLVLWVSMAIVPLLPTVFLNSSYLAQCDSIYAAFVLGSVYYFLSKRQLLSILFLSVAFAFKMQTAILLPFYFVLMLRGDVKWYYFLLIPLVYFVAVLPVWFYGRPMTELLSIYLSQSNNYQFLTLNFPNIYTWISNDYYEPVKTIGVILTVLITLISGVLLSKKILAFSMETWVRFAFLCAIAVPFILPGMHERYMYLGDVLGVVYYMMVRKKLYLPLGILLVSFYSYIRCSRYNDVLPMTPVFLLYAFIIMLVIHDFIVHLKTIRNEVTE